MLGIITRLSVYTTKQVCAALMTCTSHTARGDITSLRQRHADMADDLLFRWSTQQIWVNLSRGLVCLKRDNSCGFKHWFAGLKNKMPCYWSFTAEMMVCLMYQRWEAGQQAYKQDACHSWKTNTGVSSVLTVWPRQLRPYLHQLWRMIFQWKSTL